METTSTPAKPAVGIYGTDLTKPLSTLVEELRQQMVQTRGQIHDLEHAFPHWKERVQYVGGLLTCGIVALAHSNEEIVAGEIRQLDHERGRSLRFSSRGIGLDVVPGCFICGKTRRTDDPTKSTYLNNIAAFVDSKEAGEEIARWFALPHQDCARLDFRPSEPNWIQVKIGACDEHLPALKWLHQRACENHGRLRQQDVWDARKMAETTV